MSNLRKIYLLLWKNYVIQTRTPVRTFIQFLIPLIMCFILLGVRFLVKSEDIRDPVHFDKFNSRDCAQASVIPMKSWNVAYSPSGHPTVERIVKHMNTYAKKVTAGGGRHYEFEPYPNDKSIEKKINEGKAKDTMLAGFSFDTSDFGNGTSPIKLNVKIRFPGLSRYFDNDSTTLDTQAPNWKTHLPFPLYAPFGPRDAHTKFAGQPGYCIEGFFSLQQLIFRGIMEEYSSVSQIPEVDFQKFPYPPYVKDQYLPAMILFISIFIIVMYTFSSVTTVKMITLEKETQMKSAMKIMGLPNWMHWTAWTIKEFIQWMLPSIAITFLLTFEWEKGAVIRKSDPSIVLMILAAYTISSIMFCFLISVCFNRANSAATVASALWFLSYSPFMVLQPHYDSMSWVEITSWSLISNTNIGFLFQFVVNFEGAGMGLQWNNLFDINSPNDKVSAGDLLILLLLDAFIYFCITIYIETAFPGHYGIAKPWYFPLQSSYWFGSEKTEDYGYPKKGIVIRNLTKIYRNGKLAVDNLSLDMFENQITVLLGNNGAGKSSTMSMLSGMIKPTSGIALINGHDIWADKSKIRSSLGLCPQYNLLFPEMTIKEHLIFFGMLKGQEGHELESEIEKYVKRLVLESKLNNQAGTLSGGYQRKLSVAIALIGKSKVVLMDEPTSGMDPVARRHLWDLLQAEREGRTMVMTTHLMDEADLLGDRVAILCNGQLKCAGTPFCLKTDPDGYRYTLNLVKKSPEENVDKMTAFLQSISEKIRLTSISETEVKYQLQDSGKMADLLAGLDEEKRNIGVKEFGVSLISLEDVYTRVTGDLAEENSKKGILEKDAAKIKEISSSVSSRTASYSVFIQEVKGVKAELCCQRWRSQFFAMLLKKILVTRRSWKMLFLQCLMTLTFFLIAIVVTKSWKGSSDLVPLEFSLNTYQRPLIVESSQIKNYETSFLKDRQKSSKSFVNIVRDIVKEQTGDLKYTKEDDADDYILSKYDENIQTVNDRYMALYEYQSSNDIETIRMHFNNQPYHSFPIVYNILQNATFKLLTRDENSLQFINHPFPYIPSERITKLEGGSNLGFQIGFCIGFVQAFICAIYLLPTMKEKANGAKHLQFVSGVAPTAYWSASVFCDFLMYLLPLSVLVVALYCYQDAAYSDPKQLVQVAILLIAYDWAIMPVINAATYLFRVPTLAFLITSVMGLFAGCATFLINLILEIRPLMLVDEADSMDDVMVWFPHYSLCNGLRNIYANYDYENSILCNKTTGCKYDGPYSWERPAIGRNLFCLFIVGLALNIILLSIENVFDKKRKLINIIWKYWSHMGKKSGAEHEMKQQSSSEDDDVTQEKYIVEKSSKLDYCVLLKDVSKKYGRFEAVKSINLALGAHECFALLGSNGAGKTTTFKMLTSKVNVTSGTIDICSMDIVRQQDKVSRVIGYCPQEDALLEKLTGRETLRLFCTLRGIPSEDVNLVINQLSCRLIFHKFLDVPSGSYSGGNKRKLNTAVAMIGDPPVLLLDEPTSGMDPDARRHLWNVIKEERERGKCIIITTHSLEECEALCTRLAIMAEGQIRCIGSVQHLKNKYASGYKLHVKFPPKLKENVKLHVSVNLPGSCIHEQFTGMILFHIPTNISCSSVFYMMEEAKQKSIIEDYSIQQTSLEQVFTRVIK